MTKEEMQTAISDKIGFDLDYLKDLNAMQEAEKRLTTEQDTVYHSKLAVMLCHAVGYEWEDGYAKAISASAAQRAEAFCRTFWSERFEK